MIRTIQAPGIELREVDRSDYNKQDYSLVGTTSLVTGVSDKGDNYNINWINTIQNFVDTYGAPETEEEKWFYNAANEVLTKGGILLAARLPYKNVANDGTKMAYADYSIDVSYTELSANSELSDLTAIDSSLRNYIVIQSRNGSSGSGYMTLAEFDKLKISEKSLRSLTFKDSIRFVDITRLQYEKATVVTVDPDSGASYSNEKECLGIMPVITTAANAIYYQGLLSSETIVTDLTINEVSGTQKSKGIDIDNNGKRFGWYSVQLTSSYNDSVCSKAKDRDGIKMEEENGTNVYFVFDDSSKQWKQHSFLPQEYTGRHKNGTFVSDLSCFSPIKDFKEVYRPGEYIANRNDWQSDNFSIGIDSTSINDNTVASIATSYFPTISYADDSRLDKTYLKKIGVVVFKVVNDGSSQKHISFEPVESYIGSIDKNAKDELTKQSIFIDDIVNSSSQYINMFTSFSKDKALENADIIVAKQQIATSMGFYKSMCAKTIDYQSTVLNALNTIFDLAKDTNKYNIDLVLDAGVSNMAQRIASGYSDNSLWTLANSSQTSVWKAVQQKFNIFCSSTRKDCMFLADGLRPFCLEGNQKIVRPTAPTHSVSKDIVPKLKYMTGLNSSYAAGYCNWFQAYDAYSGDLIWLPPSIKMAGVYIYTDIYFNKWDAPAGMSRGRLTNVVDCAFSPTQQDAEKIYLQSWNYAVSYPIDGIIVEGQKTFQTRPTAFDRVNVRRLFLHLEKEVARIAKYFLYEGNTEYQRARFVDSIKPIFDNAVNRNGIKEYYIKCDDENNTPFTIDNNELRCAIAVKPVKSIEFIVLTFVCTNQSAIVSESLANV